MEVATRNTLAFVQGTIDDIDDSSIATVNVLYIIEGGICQ